MYYDKDIKMLHTKFFERIDKTKINGWNDEMDVKGNRYVKPIDWGKMERDRQELIDGAFQYVGGSEFTASSGDINKKRNWGAILPILFILIIVSVSGTFALDYLNIIDLGIF
jgi:hypothetical protein